MIKTSTKYKNFLKFMTYADISYELLSNDCALYKIKVCDVIYFQNSVAK